MAAELLGRMDAAARGAPAAATTPRPRIAFDRRPHRAQVHKGRSVLRPEVCRTRTFGEQGSSAGQFFGEYLSRIELSTRAVVWSGADVSYLRCCAPLAFASYNCSRAAGSKRTTMAFSRKFVRRARCAAWRRRRV